MHMATVVVEEARICQRETLSVVFPPLVHIFFPESIRPLHPCQYRHAPDNKPVEISRKARAEIIPDAGEGDKLKNDGRLEKLVFGVLFRTT